MASEETIQSLANLLNALQSFNKPEREAELYAKKALIDFDIQKKLIGLQMQQDEFDKKQAIMDTGLLESQNILSGVAMGTIKEETSEEMEKTRKGLEWKDWGVVGGIVKGAGKLFFDYDPDVGYRINNVVEYVAQPEIQSHITNVISGVSKPSKDRVDSIMQYKTYLEKIDLTNAPDEQKNKVGALLTQFNRYLQTAK